MSETVAWTSIVYYGRLLQIMDITAKSVDDMIINFLLFLAKWSKDIFSSFSSVNHFQKGSYDYVLNRYEKIEKFLLMGTFKDLL